MDWKEICEEDIPVGQTVMLFDQYCNEVLFAKRTSETTIEVGTRYLEDKPCGFVRGLFPEEDHIKRSIKRPSIGRYSYFAEEYPDFAWSYFDNPYED